MLQPLAQSGQLRPGDNRQRRLPFRQLPPQLSAHRRQILRLHRQYYQIRPLNNPPVVPIRSHPIPFRQILPPPRHRLPDDHLSRRRQSRRQQTPQQSLRHRPPADKSQPHKTPP